MTLPNPGNAIAVTVHNAVTIVRDTTRSNPFLLSAPSCDAEDAEWSTVSRWAYEERLRSPVPGEEEEVGEEFDLPESSGSETAMVGTGSSVGGAIKGIGLIRSSPSMVTLSYNCGIMAKVS